MKRSSAPIVAQLEAVEKEHQAKFGTYLFDDEDEAIERFYLY